MISSTMELSYLQSLLEWLTLSESTEGGSPLSQGSLTEVLLSTFDLLIKVACLVTKINNIFKKQLI